MLVAQVSVNDLPILNTLKGKQPMSSYDIGLALGKSKSNASAWSCRYLKSLYRRGLVNKTALDNKYFITHTGINYLTKRSSPRVHNP